MKEQKWLKLFWIILILLIAWQVLVLLDPFMLSIQGSLIFAVLTYPLFKYFTRKTNRKHLSAALVILIVFIIVVIPLSVLTVGLVNQANSLTTIPDEYIDSIENTLTKFGADVDLRAETVQVLGKAKETIFQNILTILSKFTDMLLNIFIFFFLMFYLLLYGPKVVEFVKRYLPFDTARNSHYVIEGTKIIKGVVFGAVLTALIQGFLGGLGFAVFGVGSPLFWGFVMAIFSLLPIIGTWLIWAPASILLIATGNVWQGIMLVIYGGLIVSQADNFLKPYISAKMGKVHPIVIVLGVFAGVALFGVVGLLSGPIFLGLTVLMVQYFHSEENIVLEKPKKTKLKRLRLG